jgi:hypothetical protein
VAEAMNTSLKILMSAASAALLALGACITLAIYKYPNIFDLKIDAPHALAERLIQIRPDSGLVAVSKIEDGRISLHLKNTNPFGIKNPEIICDFYSKSGEHLRSAKALVSGEISGRSMFLAPKVDFGPIPQRTDSQICYCLSAGRM